MKNVRQRLLASTLLFGAAAAPGQVFAQTTPTEPPANQTAPVTSQPDINAGTQDPGSSGQSVGAPVPAPQDIIITGSRIPRPDLTSSSPLAVVKNEEFQLSGASTVEQVLNAMPQVIPSFTAFSNNPGNGAALINLRGLGTKRNLVLVNGRRWMFFDPTQRVDLNTIPSFLVDSVDVVTGGASAVYGSDAVAGVSNFHLRTDLEGALVGGSYAITQRGDGPRTDIYGAIGTRFADGRGNVTVYGEYYDRDSIFQSQRPWSDCTFLDTGEGSINSREGWACGGSTNTPFGRFRATQGSGTGTPFAGSFGGIFATPGVARPFISAGVGNDRYNYAPVNYLMIPAKRFALGGYGEYEVLDGHHLYTEVSYSSNRVLADLAPTPLTQNVNVPLTGPNGFCVTPGAPGQLPATTCAQFATISARQLAANAAAIAGGVTDPTALPFGQLPAGTGTVGALQPGFVRLEANFRILQAGLRVNEDDRNAFRVLGGARGEITSDWNYDVYYMYSRTKDAQHQTGNGTRSGFAQNVENGTCNIFGFGLLSQACIAGITTPATNLFDSTLEVADGSVTGHLFTFPTAHDAVGVALGAEYRRMDAHFDPDSALATGDVVGFNSGAPTGGNYDAKELYGELRVPIVEQQFIDRLELNGGFRYSKYSLRNVGGVWTYFAGAELSPIKDIMLRGQYQRAIRAPNISELFGGAAAGFPVATDPCSTLAAVNDAAVRATCIATGVPANTYTDPTDLDHNGIPDAVEGLQPNSQIEGNFPGNPNLQEEQGDTYTAGVVLRPRFVPRLNVAVDWYKIRVKGATALLGGGLGGVLNQCYNVIQDPNNFYCQQVNRDPSGVLSGGSVFVVQVPVSNIGQLDTQGIDVQVDYSVPLTFGLLGQRSKLSAYWFGNHQWDASFIPVPGAPTVQCVGKWGPFGPCGEPTPKWKWTSRIAWADGPLTTSIRWRYIGKVVDDTPGSGNFDVEAIPAHNYFDLAFALDVTDNATMTFGINNLLDKKPPLMGSTSQSQANTWPSTYDPLGRDFFFSVNFKL